MTQPLSHAEDNSDGFWNRPRRRALRQLDRAAEGQGRRTLGEWISDHQIGVLAGTVTVALGALAGLLVNMQRNEPDSDQYRPERVHERVLSSADALRIMGLCEDELRAQAQLEQYRAEHGAASSAPIRDSIREVTLLETAASLARDNNVSCQPEPGDTNGRPAGTYRLPIPGGNQMIPADSITHFSGDPTDACTQLYIFNRDDKAVTEFAEGSLAATTLALQVQILDAQDILCPAQP